MFFPPKRKITSVFIHCSASDHMAHDDVSVIRKWHMGRGWSDIGYHYFIKKDGTIQTGRDLNRTPAAQKNRNTGTIAICCHGLDKDQFTKAQMDSLRKLCTEIRECYNGLIPFRGHCEASPKTCPVFDYKKELQLDRFGLSRLP